MSVETSILISTYNHGKYLMECIGSILRQEYTNYEIIIINDYSSDSTETILKRLSLIDSRIKTFNNTKQKGLANALNYGITLCRGKYIARMDADDLMTENRLKEQITYLKSNTDIHAVCSGIQLVDNNYIPIRQSYENTDMEISKLMLLFYNTYVQGSMTIKKEVLKKYRYKKKFTYSEDYELWTRIVRGFNIVHIPNIHHIYRIHKKNEQNKLYFDNYTQSILTILSNHLNYYNISHTDRELIIHYGLFFEKNQIGTDLERKNWLTKIFTSKKIIETFSDNTIKMVRNQIFNKFNIT